MVVRPPPAHLSGSARGGSAIPVYPKNEIRQNTQKYPKFIQIYPKLYPGILYTWNSKKVIYRIPVFKLQYTVYPIIKAPVYCIPKNPGRPWSINVVLLWVVPFANNTNLSTEAHIPTPQYGQYLTHAHKHITPLIDSCFVLIRTHEHGIAPGERFHLRSFTPPVKRRVQICSANVGIVSIAPEVCFQLSLFLT